MPLTTTAFSPPSPPWTKLGRRLESTVRKALYEFAMIPSDGSPVAVALSGGKDSLTMLFLLNAIRGRGFPKCDLIALHVGGAFSCGANVSTRSLEMICASLSIPFVCEKTEQRLETLECYSCSRKRRSLLFRAAKRYGATTIAFGHHRDDNAETVLMNLLHKGEFCGLMPKISMHAYGITIIRPLVYVAEADISHFADQYLFRRISCRCPVGQTSMRRKTECLIEELEKVYPNARENIAQAALQYGSKKATYEPKGVYKNRLPVLIEQEKVDLQKVDLQKVDLQKADTTSCDAAVATAKEQSAGDVDRSRSKPAIYSCTLPKSSSLPITG